MADIDFNIDECRASHDSNTEWAMRRRFLLAHHDKFSFDRLLCLASCYISVECYGNRYPNPVMRLLHELTKDFPESQVSINKRNRVQFVKSSEKSSSTNSKIETQNAKQDQLQSAQPTRSAQSIFDSPFIKNQVKFVKASDPFSSAQPFDAASVPNLGETSTIFDTPVPTFCPSPVPKKSPGLMFVKSTDNYHSTDISHPDSSSTSQAAAQQPDITQYQSSGSKKGFGFISKKGHGLAAVTQQFKSLSQCDDDLSKLYALSRQIQDLSKKRRNAIETLHMAVDKVRMLLSPVIDIGPLGQFVCLLRIDFIMVAKGFATNKKAAKHNAYEKATEVLLKPYFRINKDDPENQVLEYSDEPFDVVKHGNDVPGDDGVTEMDQSNQGSSQTVDNRKRPAPGTAAALSQFLLIEPQKKSESYTSASLIRQSAAINKYDFELEFANHGNQTRATIYLGGCLIADVLALNKTEGKTLANATALEYLRTICWTIQTKRHEDTDEASITRDEMLGDIQSDLKNARISDSNIGSKLMKKMGWVGGGLGKEGNEGICEPITADQVINREGLGLRAEQGISRDFQPRMKQLVQDYVRSGKQEDLVFSPLFLKEERALIHKEAQKLGLKTHSHSSGENRYLVISRKRTAGELFSHVLNSGGETSKYVLIPPKQDDYE